MIQNQERSSAEEAARPTPARSNRMGIRSLIVLVACCGAILWAYRYLSENYDPVSVEFRTILKRSILSLQSGNKKEQLGAIEAIARLPRGDKAAAISSLSEVIESPDSEVRSAAADLLHAIAWDLASSPSADATLPAVEAALIRRIKIKTSDADLRVKVVATLGGIAIGLADAGNWGKLFDDATKTLVASVKDPSPQVRETAAEYLGGIAAPNTRRKAIPPAVRVKLLDAIVETLDDEDHKVRRAAIVGLARNPDANGNPPSRLAEGLKDIEATNRMATVEGLAYYRAGLDPWVPRLLALIEHDLDPKVRERCANIIDYALKPPGITPAVVPVLEQSLRNPNVKLRSLAASMLGKLGSDARVAIPELIRLLNEPLQPGVVPVMGPATTTFDPGCAAAFALGRIAPGSSQSKEVIEALIEVARSGPVSRRGWAAASLGEFRESAEEAVPILIQMIKDAEPEGTFEREASAAKALGQIAPETPPADQAIKALLPLLESKIEINRQKAVEALARFGTKAAAAIPRIRELKKDSSVDVSNAAERALLDIENLGSH